MKREDYGGRYCRGASKAFNVKGDATGSCDVKHNGSSRWSSSQSCPPSSSSMKSMSMFPINNIFICVSLPNTRLLYTDTKLLASFSPNIPLILPPHVQRTSSSAQHARHIKRYQAPSFCPSPISPTGGSGDRVCTISLTSNARPGPKTTPLRRIFRTLPSMAYLLYSLSFFFLVLVGSTFFAPYCVSLSSNSTLTSSFKHQTPSQTNTTSPIPKPSALDASPHLLHLKPPPTTLLPPAFDLR